MKHPILFALVAALSLPALQAVEVAQFETYMNVGEAMGKAMLGLMKN
jgi:hypothetical protein